MRAIIAAVLNVAAVAGGVAVGTTLRPGGGGAAQEAPSEGKPDGEAVANEKPAASHGEEDTHAGKDARGSQHGEAKTSSDTLLVRFSRPFVVPVADGWRTQGLVVMSLGVEIDRKTELEGLEARMRDRITTVLVGLAHEGAFDAPVADPATYERVRSDVAAAVSPLVEGGAKGVLVTDMVKRPV